MKFGTKAIHSGLIDDPVTGAIIPPIYQTSTYAQKAPGEHKGYEYSRTQNPTRTALEQNIAAIENAQHGLCFSSGMGAIDAIIKLLNPGDEVIANNDLYGGTYRLFANVFSKYGIKFHFVSMESLEEATSLVNSNTKLFWVETPSNPMMNITDISAVSMLAKKASAFLVVDNTFASPYLQNPIDMGAEIVLHSATKYLGGHSDVVMGAIATSNHDLAEKLAYIQNSCGAIPSPHDCFLVQRGIKTLHLRMQRHCENAKHVIEFLHGHQRIKHLYWPGLETHPNHAIAKEQMRDFGGMISFTLMENNLEAASSVASKTRVFTLAESLGGVESLIGHPATMTHASIPKQEREKVGVVDGLIRLSVGVEDAEDLCSDLNQALS